MMNLNYRNRIPITVALVACAMLYFGGAMAQAVTPDEERTRLSFAEQDEVSEGVLSRVAQLLRRLQENRQRRLDRRQPTTAPPIVSEAGYPGTPGKYKVGYTVLSTTAKGRTRSTVQINMAVWYPTGAETSMMTYVIGENKVQTRVARDAPALKGPFPLILYSHGATGSGLTMTFGTERLAAEGFVVVAPDYTDQHYAARITGPVHLSLLQTAQMVRWMSQLRDNILNKGGVEHRHKYLMYRPAQASAAIDRILQENRREASILYGRIDEERIGAFGHSFGAWTSMLIAGADSGALDPRIKAIVALSGPVNNDVYARHEIAQIKVPILFMYGGEEPGVGRASDKQLLYDRATSTKYLIAIRGADHATFSGGIREEYPTVTGYLQRDSKRAAIVRYTEAFLKRYIMNDLSADSILQARDSSLVAHEYTLK